MAHKLDKHYKDFGGVDSRSNPLVQNPKAARRGSKNFRHNYQDETQRREGFQHKSDEAESCASGLIEYKFKDINTGEARIEILGVGSDGRLRKRKSHRLKLTADGGALITYYSFFYDEAASTFKFKAFDALTQTLHSINVSLTDTLSDLKTAINALSIYPDLTADIVDEEGTTVASTLKAYLLDVEFETQFEVGVTDTQYNPVYYWEEIETPDGLPAFTNVVAMGTDEDYEGVVSFNLNNALYLTDGGFVYKYDGAALYRAGMPKILQQYNSGLGNYSGFTYTSNAGGSVTAGEHRYLVQLRYKDRNGVQIIGKLQPTANIVSDPAALTLNVGYNYFTSAAGSYLTVNLPCIKQNPHFPVYAAECTSTLLLATGTNVISVASGHNLKVGMCLRPISRETTPTFYLKASYLEITAVSATSVTVSVPAALGGVYTVTNGITYNGCYVPDDFVGETEIGRDLIPYGVSYLFLSTKAAGTSYYIARLAPVPYITSQEYSTSLDIPDSQLVQAFSGEYGEDLPRACKYFSEWQTQMVQAGRPVNSATLAALYYPTLYDSTQIDTINKKYEFTVSESGLCDFQSAYWNDPDYPEGFPRSGLTEESFESKFNDQITGIAQNKDSLFVFKNRTTAYVSGTLATGDLNKEFLETDVGSACHKVIQEVRGALVFMDQNLGFWSVVAGRLPEFIGYPVMDYFKNNATVNLEDKLNFKKAHAANFRIQDQYICYVPGLFDLFGDTNSVMFVYDVADVAGGGIRGEWYIWNGAKAAGGILATSDDELLIAEENGRPTKLMKQKFSGSKYDFSDHTSAIEMNYKASFVALGEPVIDKQFINCLINSVQGGFDLTVKQYVNFIDTVVADFDIEVPVPENTVKQVVKLISDKVSSVSVGFYNNEVNQDVRIDGWEIEYSPSFDTGEGKK